MTAATALTVRMLSGFDDLDAATWARLLAAGDTDAVFLTRPYLAAWWGAFGRGGLLLLLAEEDGTPVALAPLFTDGGMAFFVGSGGSDYLDVLGDADTEVLVALLDAARQSVPGFVGFRFYHVPDASRTGARLQAAAARLGLVRFDEGHLPAPALALRDAGVAREAANKKSLRRHENALRREGRLAVTHLTDGAAIRPHLPAFFAQHEARWADTPWPSLFHDPAQRRFYERLTETAGDAGWLRFTRVTWDDRPVAFHFGFCLGGRYLWYKPSFDVALARRSPGEVLLRHLLLAAAEEDARTFDFGLGDEPFKRRFATHVPTVRTWGLYPPEVL